MPRGTGKNDEALIERIEGLLSLAPVRRRGMFGSVAWFLEANDMMFTAVTGDSVMVRLGEVRTKKLIDSGIAGPFPPGTDKPMREYVLLSGDRVAEDGDLLNWLEEASEYAESLPRKQKKSRRKK